MSGDVVRFKSGTVAVEVGKTTIYGNLVFIKIPNLVLENNEVLSYINKVTRDKNSNFIVKKSRKDIDTVLSKVDLHSLCSDAIRYLYKLNISGVLNCSPRSEGLHFYRETDWLYC